VFFVHSTNSVEALRHTHSTDLNNGLVLLSPLGKLDERAVYFFSFSVRLLTEMTLYSVCMLVNISTQFSKILADIKTTSQWTDEDKLMFTVGPCVGSNT